MVPHPRQALVEIQLPLQLGDAAIDGPCRLAGGRRTHFIQRHPGIEPDRRALHHLGPPVGQHVVADNFTIKGQYSCGAM